jgi:DNA-3-methyladenine glycosylase
MARLPKDFYNRDTVQVSQDLLGKYLVRSYNGELLVGRITETEAYIGRCDKACHAYHYKRTARTETLFMAPGHAYIYLIYGMYHCLNFVTEAENEPAAVLIRAVEPLAGIDTIYRLRFGDKPLSSYRLKNFMNGPGKVCQGFALTKLENKLDLESDSLYVCDSLEELGIERPVLPKERMCVGPRIGIDYAEEARDFPWRFWLEKED